MNDVLTIEQQNKRRLAKIHKLKQENRKQQRQFVKVVLRTG